MTVLARRTLLASLAAAPLASPHVARAAVRELRLAHSQPTNTHIHGGAAAFAEAVAAHPALKDVLRIVVHPGSALGDDASVVRGVVNGTIDLSLIGNSTASDHVPELGLLNAPFLFDSTARARGVLDSAVGAELIQLAATKGLHILAWGENGMRHAAAHKPIRSAADLRGLKIRLAQSEIMVNGFRALGAQPGQLAFTRLRDALVAGEFEAMESPIIAIESGRFFEVVKTVSLTGHVYDAGDFICSGDVLEDLAPAQRAALRACAAEGAKKTREVNDASEAKVLERLRAAGVTVVTDMDSAGLRQAAAPFIAELQAKYTAEPVRKLVSAVG